MNQSNLMEFEKDDCQKEVRKIIELAIDHLKKSSMYDSEFAYRCGVWDAIRYIMQKVEEK